VRGLALAWVVLVIVTGARDASAQLRPRSDLPIIDDGRKLCDRGKTWSQIASCFAKRGSVRVLYETSARKVVAYQMPHWGNDLQIHLYVTTHKGWQRARFFVFVHPDQELFAVAQVTASGETFRIDIGHVTRTFVRLDPVTSVRAVLRRIQTHVCSTEPSSCQSLVTACETYVRGKLAFAFRGELAWRHGLWRLRGDPSRVGGACTVSRSQIVDESEDP
jgi:hypothetical protein